MDTEFIWKILFVHRLKSNISRNRFWTIAEFFVKTILAFVLISIIAKSLGVVSLGVFTYWLTVAGLLSGLSKLGLDAIILREVPVMNDSTVIIMPAFKTSVVAGSILYIFSAIIHFFTLAPSEYYGFIIITFTVIFSSYNVIDSYYKAIEQSQINFYIKIPIHLVFFGLKIYFLREFSSLLILALITLIEQALISCVYYIVIFKNSTKKPIQDSYEFFSKHKESIVKITLASSIALLYLRTDTIVIKYLLGDTDLGIYTAGARIVEFLLSTIVLYSIALAPSIVKNINSIERTALVIKRFMLQLFVFWFSGIVFLYIFGEELILIIFGNEFYESYSIFWTYYIFVIFAAFGSIMQRIYFANKDDNFVFVKSIVAFVLNLVANLILIKSLGLIGAIYSTGLAIVITNMVFPMFIPKYRNLIFKLFASTKYHE